MLDYHYLTFLTVCETLNYTEAARRLNLTQPAVSKHIAQLQEELGVTLLEYKQKRLYLTEAGQYLYKLVAHMKKEGDLGLSSIFDDDRPLPISLACTFTIGNFLIAQPLMGLLQRFPNTQLNLVVENTRTLLRDLSLDQVDCAFVEGHFDHKQYQHRLYRREPLVAVAAPTHPLVGQEKVSWEDLRDHQLITREIGSGLGRLVEDLLSAHNLSLSDLNTSHIGNYQVIKEFVMNGLGVAFLYRSAVVKEIANGSLKELHFDTPLPAPEMYFIYKRPNAAVERILANYDLFEETPFL
ncbi:MAG TPA: LysR family transcriptional regulator [Candidatus Enterococcus stercoravium]|nr:LysR family transcriptional regulator [Candidatus Enterococcus stercoravium]